MNWKKHILTFAVILFFLLILFAPRQGCRPGSGQSAGRPPGARIVELIPERRPVPGSPLSQYSYTLRAEVADTKEKRQQGLSGRAGLEAGCGMLYVYEEPQQPEFSEATTRFPLSLAFIKEDGTIAEIHNAEANDPTCFTPREPVKYLLEARSGWFQDRSISAGDRFHLPPELTKGSPAKTGPAQPPPTAP